MIFSELVKEVQRLSKFYNDQLPDSYPVGIHKAVLERNLDMVAQLIVSGEDVNSRDSFHGCTVLHLAVITKNIVLLKYFLDMDSIGVDAKCSEGRTPLYVAAALGYLEFAEKLIENGADVNISDRDHNPLSQVAIFHPEVCHFLITHGVRIDAVNWWGRTLLHNAVAYKCDEVMHMLLYYNADSNITDRQDLTPFMIAILKSNIHAQEALLEYVNDFNRVGSGFRYLGSTLSFALNNNSPFIKDIIERGALINYGDDPDLIDEDCALYACLRYPLDSSTFKMVWERLRYNHTKNTINLLNVFRNPRALLTYLPVIIDSDNFNVAVQFLSKGDNYFLFVNEFAMGKYELEQLTALTCRLLEHGFRPSSYDIHAIFSHYGYCELFRILLYMDIDVSRGWLPHMVLPRIIFDVNYDLKSVTTQLNDIPRDTLVQLLEYTICPPLIEALNLQYSDDQSMSTILGSLPRVPSLVELARNPARKHIWQSFKIRNTCQFYTIIDHLHIPIIYKNILTFKKKMYMVT